MTVPRRVGICHTFIVIFALATGAAPGPAQATEGAALTITLNVAAAIDAGGCRLSFVIRNDLGADIESLVAEAVLFDGEGRVATMTLFDFGTLPEGRPRVRQFDLAGRGCDGIGGILVNGIGTCEGDGLTPAACLTGLRLSSETAIEVTG